VIPVGGSSGLSSDTGYTLSIQPEEISAELQRAYTLDFFATIDSLGRAKLNAEIYFGKLATQADYFDFALDYHGMTCLITAKSPSCSSAFNDYVLSRFLDSSSWIFDPIKNVFVSLVSIDFPSLSADYKGTSSIGYVNIFDGGIAEASASAEAVPAPLPLLGVGAAFGFSRKLRRRIKSSNTPEDMCAID
jgi:hypothetical protein